MTVHTKKQTPTSSKQRGSTIACRPGTGVGPTQFDRQSKTSASSKQREATITSKMTIQDTATLIPCSVRPQTYEKNKHPHLASNVGPRLQVDRALVWDLRSSIGNENTRI